MLKAAVWVVRLKERSLITRGTCPFSTVQVGAAAPGVPQSTESYLILTLQTDFCRTFEEFQRTRQFPETENGILRKPNPSSAGALSQPGSRLKNLCFSNF